MVKEISVCVKMGPCEAGDAHVWSVSDGRSIQLIDSFADPCVFDYALDQSATNQQVFDCLAKPIVYASMQGHNGTIFSYGQTSSGKSFTMVGDDANPGLMALAAKEIVKQLNNDKDREFLLRVGYVEVNNQKIFDLLKRKLDQDLHIYENANGLVKINCKEAIITSEADMLRFFGQGNKKRTKRSHAVLRIIIESRLSDGRVDGPVNQSVLNLVDLAGSSNLIGLMSDNQIKFRDEKLNRILRSSLGGNAYTGIICTINPGKFLETQSTLNFAMQAMRLRNDPQVNEVGYDVTMMKTQERKIKKLKASLAQSESFFLSSPQIKASRMSCCSHCRVSCKDRKEKLANRDQMKMLSALPQNNLAKGNPRKTLHELSRDVLHDSRQEQIRSMCPELESSCERICLMCLQLERLVADTESKCAEIHQRECDKLRVQVAVARSQLEDMHLAYSMAMCQVSEKTEDCNRLNLKLSTAQEDNAQLQGKYDGLEQMWQSQQKLIQSMEADYQSVQQKYEKMQQEYQNLEGSSKSSIEYGLQLEGDNTALQAEIVTLKERLEEVQRLLLEAANGTAMAERQLKAQNDEFKAELSEVQTSYADMLFEYDCMNNQLMESVQECDVLRNECSALREENTSLMQLEKEFTKVCSVNRNIFEANKTLRANLITQEETFKKEQESLKEHLNSIVTGKEEHNSELESQLKETRANLRTQEETFKKEQESLKEHFKSIVTAKEEHNSELESQLKETKAQNLYAFRQQQGIISVTHDKCVKIRNELNKSRQLVEKLEDQNAASRARIVAQKEANKKLNKQVERLRTLIKRNTNSLDSAAVNETLKKHSSKCRKFVNSSSTLPAAADPIVSIELNSEAVNGNAVKHTSKCRKVSNASSTLPAHADRINSASRRAESRRVHRRCIHDQNRQVFSNEKEKRVKDPENGRQ